MLVHLRNLGTNPTVSKTASRNRWSTLSNALTHMNSSAPLQCRPLYSLWSDEPRAGCFGLIFRSQRSSAKVIRSPASMCRLFAKTPAKIFYCVLQRHGPVIILFYPDITVVFIQQSDHPFVVLPEMASWSNQLLNTYVEQAQTYVSS